MVEDISESPYDAATQRFLSKVEHPLWILQDLRALLRTITIAASAETILPVTASKTEVPGRRAFIH